MGQQLVQAPELQLARGPALAGFASLFVQGWQKSPWGGRAKQQKFVQWSGSQVLVVMEVLDTGIQRGPEPLACPNPCCDLPTQSTHLEIMYCVLLIMQALPYSPCSFRRFGLEVRHIQASGSMCNLGAYAAVEQHRLSGRIALAFGQKIAK